jgi:hypothetical protein
MRFGDTRGLGDASRRHKPEQSGRYFVAATQKGAAAKVKLSSWHQGGHQGKLRACGKKASVKQMKLGLLEVVELVKGAATGRLRGGRSIYSIALSYFTGTTNQTLMFSRSSSKQGRLLIGDSNAGPAGSTNADTHFEPLVVSTNASRQAWA